jgi:hypothetical protein
VDDYQAYNGNVNLVGAGDVGYSRPIYVSGLFDDGIAFPLRAPIFLAPPHYGRHEPPITAKMSQEAASAAAQKTHDSYGFTLVPLNAGPFEGACLIDTTQLVLPQGIDLAKAVELRRPSSGEL